MTTELRPWVGPLSVSRIARLPPPPENGDGNRWTLGRCWFWCGQVSARVLWIGTGAASGGITADLFACEACVQMLNDQILCSVMAADDRGVAPLGYAEIGHSGHGHAAFPEVPAGRHRRRT